jgi:hypothetical protein
VLDGISNPLRTLPETEQHSTAECKARGDAARTPRRAR